MRRWGQSERESAGQDVWWCVDVPENWISLSHRAATEVDESLCCTLAACSTLIIKWCSSQSSDLVRVGLSNLLLSTKLTAVSSCLIPFISSSSPSNESLCIYIFFFYFQFWSVPLDYPCNHSAVAPVLMSLPRHASSSYISFQLQT